MDVGEEHNGSFGVYMRNKIAKLGDQVPDQLSNIFAGVRAHVNGYTTPSLQELRYLISMHGGR